MRPLLLALVGLLLVVVGVGIGWYVRPVPPPAVTPAVVYRPADPQLLAPSSGWEEWKYPGSEPHFATSGGGFRSESLELTPAARIALVTPDDLPTVWSFYQAKCKLRPQGDANTTNRVDLSGIGGQTTVTLFDDVRGHVMEGPAESSAEARGFTVQSLRYTLTGFVHRPKGATATTILLVYRPNSELLSVLRAGGAGKE